MINRRSSKPGHSSEEQLALLLRGDLGRWEAWRTRRHVAGCEVCKEQLGSLRNSLAVLRSQAASETLTSFEAIVDWKRLEHEMTGNIVVGLAAARCIEKVGPKPHWPLRLAFASGLALVFAAAWFTHIPTASSERIFDGFSSYFEGKKTSQAGSIIQTTPTGIAVRSQGVTLTILHPGPAVVSSSGPASMEARYIDEESGQVTINNVYGQ